MTCALVGVVAVSACATVASPRYIVTTTPFAFLAPAHPGFCVAVDPTDPNGVWWWEPGLDGCASRSTGPSVFPGDKGKVTAVASGAHDIHFEIQLMTGPPKQVDLRLDSAGIRWLAGDVTVPVERRPTLELPESSPPSRTSR